eukprot:COSAG02_NODE_6070_length_3826_cov_2.878723_7_plen_88_part_01
MRAGCRVLSAVLNPQPIVLKMDIISLVYTYPHTERCLHIGTPVQWFAWNRRWDRRLAKREHLVTLVHSRIIPFAKASQSLAEVELHSV